ALSHEMRRARTSLNGSKYSIIGNAALYDRLTVHRPSSRRWTKSINDVSTISERSCPEIRVARTSALADKDLGYEHTILGRVAAQRVAREIESNGGEAYIFAGHLAV